MRGSVATLAGVHLKRRTMAIVSYVNLGRGARMKRVHLQTQPSVRLGKFEG